MSFTRHHFRDLRTIYFRSMDPRRAMGIVLMMVGGMVHAQNAAQLIAQGDSLLVNGKYAKAVEHFDAAIKAQPDARSYAARAAAWYVMDEPDRMLQDVDKALKLDSISPEANYQRALYAMRGQSWTTAEVHADRAMRHSTQEPLRSRAQILRGEARAEMKRYSTALRDLEEGTRLVPNDAGALRVLAQLYDQNKEHEKALLILDHLCKLEPKEMGHLVNKGFELALLGRHAEALAVYDEAAKFDAEEPVLLSNRAFSLMELGRNDVAMKEVKRGLHHEPGNPFALRTRAILYLRRGEREKACEDLQVSKAIGPGPEVDALILEHCSGVPRD
jgi:tetratricopeptide (TPR) repeat protein